MKKRSKLILVAVMATITILAGILFLTSMNYHNREVSLRNLAEAQRGNIENVADKMWKVIQQKAQVSDQYRKSFKEIYPALIEGRYSSGDGALMKWIKEDNPRFDISLYKDLMNSIEVERQAFSNEQTRMLDIIREHKTLCQQFPGNLFLSDKQDIAYHVISSTHTHEVMRTGVDDDIDLFN